MRTSVMRKIVKIDEAKCDGCGLCVPGCAEGAIRMIDGKARLVAESLCDGLGNCLGKCPVDAITIQERPAEEFDEKRVRMHKQAQDAARPHGTGKWAANGQDIAASLDASDAARAGCPGSMPRKLKPGPANPQAGAAPQAPGAASRLGQWPVQLALVPPEGDIWHDADVLVAADCVAFAMGDFHERLLAGKTLAIACPKLDDVEPYIRKLERIFAVNRIKSVTVAHMEVPCCFGIVQVVRKALERAGKTHVPVHDVTVGVDGSVKP